MQTVDRRIGSPALDPTLEEMREYLAGAGFYEPMGDDGAAPECAGLDGDAEAAIWFYASDWHGGQDSNLYSALSCSPYSPGYFSTLEDEGEQAELCYAALQARFSGEPYQN